MARSDVQRGSSSQASSRRRETYRPQGLCLDKGYGHAGIDALVDEFRFIGHIARRGQQPRKVKRSAGNTARRWLVERTHSWMNRFRLRRTVFCRYLDHVEQLFYNSSMVRIGIRELNQRTSQVLERVRRGETVIITDHGEPVARLVPIGATASVLDELIDAGKAIPPRLKASLPPAVAFGDPATDSSEVVSSLRDEA